MIHTGNKLKRHVAVGLSTIVLSLLMWFFGVHHQRIAGAIPFFLLFCIMAMGPAKRLWPSIWKVKGWSKMFPITWRSELGIWFAIWSVLHMLFVFHAREWAVIDYITGMSPWAFGAFVAVIMAVVLAATSTNKALVFLGAKSWKWLQNAAHIIWWLSVVHTVDRAVLRPGFPSADPLHWIYIIMMITVPLLQIAAFSKVVSEYRRTGNYPNDIL